MAIDVGSGAVMVHYSQDGKPVEDAERLALPSDLSDGLILTLLKNVTSKALPTTFSFVAATPKPRLVKLTVTSAGEERFSTGGRNRTAIHYVLRVDIGGSVASLPV